MKKILLFAGAVVLLVAGLVVMVIAMEQTKTEISVAALPPVVVKTVPQSGDTKVDPDLKEIRVTFSREMMDGSCSWSQISDDTFPEVTGEIHYEKGNYTCVLPCNLEPGKTCVSWLNSAKFRVPQEQFFRIHSKTISCHNFD
ncbi:MAG: Ig-like domain-containing protein [bacterium]|jgi:hypothetical protein